MPEGDTVWLTAHRLHQALAGRELTVFDLRVPQHATADLRGQTVREVVARGKHILLRTSSNLTLHTHLRMDGSWRIGPAGRRPPGLPEHMMRILLGNAEWWAAGYRVHDVALLRSSDEGRLVGHLGPDLLGPDWDAAEAVRRLRQDPDAGDRASARGSAQPRWHRQHVQVRGPVHRAGQSVDAGRSRHRPGPTGRNRVPAVAHEPEPSGAVDDRVVGRGQEHWVYERAEPAVSTLPDR